MTDHKAIEGEEIAAAQARFDVEVEEAQARRDADERYLARFEAMGHDSPDSDVIVGASHDVIEYELDEDEL